MSSTPTSCAACKFLRRKCTPECIFAPYFPANDPERFECVHRVFGASNVGKILNELHPSQREDAVKSLAFQAKARLRNPVYGCTFQVSILQQLLRQRRAVLENAKRELSAYINPPAIQGPFNPQEKPLTSPPVHLGPPCGSNVVQYSAHLDPSYDPNVVHSSAHLGLSNGLQPIWAYRTAQMMNLFLSQLCSIIGHWVVVVLSRSRTHGCKSCWRPNNLLLLWHSENSNRSI
ncbi:protein LATERAL ORGAN BOUNDARIES-like isoform X1 [Arachis ipaensis]|uniref:LOB domain-containing protein n=1 Tax=Arachis hypogaea TaxID=3818 RepID=A0A444ZFW1_ARAHY|nr:protein LATERAL ORGAN BOUNDARIES-like isoform X1 [Arachis ipaensis]RYR13080.1 hypothetical protein Ahy_B04g070263 isoform D [Arachis hypogaea]